MKISHRSKYVIMSLSVIACLGCSKATPQPEPEVVVVTKTIVESIPATPPKGVVRYCWEEPIASAEKVNAGLNTNGHWYHPAHTAINKVRQGRWRPCSPARSQVETIGVK